MSQVIAIILAAGQGTRMRSRLPKVLHRVAGKTMVEWVLAAARDAGCGQAHVVIGHGAEAVQETLSGHDLGWVRQEEQRGTGHALAQAEPAVRQPAILVVLSGDVPLVSSQTLSRLIDLASQGWGAMAVAEVDEPGALGRVVASSEGTLSEIVEAADASPEQLANRLVNAGIYALPAPQIFEYLAALEPDNAKGELYLTDALTAAARDGHPVALLGLADAGESFGVNDRSDLARVNRKLLLRKAEQLMRDGVTVIDPHRVIVEPQVAIGSDCIIHPGVSLMGETVIGSGCELYQGAWLRDTTLADEVIIEPYSVLDGAEVGDQAHIGPFARLRPGTVVLHRAKVGNFVEMKNARLGVGAKANHLAYVGDALVGEGANIGAGVVTCNYDGRSKHKTEIGDGAFIGSDTMLIAPVEIGEGAITGAGSVISKDVPPGALAVERSSQKNLQGWADRQFKRQKRK